MYWYKKLYFGDNAIDKSVEIMKSLRKNKACIGIFLVTTSDTTGSLLDIYEWPDYIPGGPIRKKRLHGDNTCVVGVASGYQDALALVRRIIDEVYQETGGFDVSAYLGVEQNKT